MAREAGIETIVATPHVLRGRWQNTSRPKLEGLADMLREKAPLWQKTRLKALDDLTSVLDELGRAPSRYAPVGGEGAPRAADDYTRFRDLLDRWLAATRGQVRAARRGDVGGYRRLAERADDRGFDADDAANAAGLPQRALASL